MSHRLEVGATCAKGTHVMRSMDDIYEYRDKSRSCRLCKREKDAANSQKYRKARAAGGAATRYGEGKYWVYFVCGHKNCFGTPLPPSGQIVFCMKCRDYSEVHRWGEYVGRLSSSR